MNITENDDYFVAYKNLIDLLLFYFIKCNFKINKEFDVEKILNKENIKANDIKELKNKIAEKYKFILELENEYNKKNILSPLLFLFNIFKFSLFEKYCFMLGEIYLHKEYKFIFDLLENNVNIKGVSTELALKIYFPLETENINIYSCFGGLVYSVLGLDDEVNSNKPLKEKQIIITDELQAFIYGVKYIDDELKSVITVEDNLNFKDDVKLIDGLDLYLDRVFKTDNFKFNVLAITGKKGSGKKTQIRVIAKKYKVRIIFVDFESLKEETIENFKRFTKKILITAYINQALVCFYNFNSKEKLKANIILNIFERYFSFLVVLSNEEFLNLDFVDDNKILINNFIINSLSEAERFYYWNLFIKEDDISKDDLEKLARGFILTVGEIKKITQQYHMERTDNYYNNIKLLKNLCVKNNNCNFGNIAYRVTQNFGWDDIILNDDCKNKLLNICNRVKYKDIIYNKLGFKLKSPYGNGISVLFYGPPGTGKTMAAQVMAKQIGYELYKIDLSQVVDKYIGETEKNLKKVFDNAKKSNIILFFDEADAIFAKRISVSNSIDKYSNIETSYLLQKIEEYDGISILATNLFSGFDEAFKRRIKFVVNFSIPDVENRFIIWQKSFPKEVKFSQDIDFLRLAEKYELTGSSIKSIAISSAFYSVDDGDKIELKHIKLALKDELEKDGKIFSEEDLNIY